MATMSIRGLDERTLSRLKEQARCEGSSVNGLVLRILRGEDAASRCLEHGAALVTLDARFAEIGGLRVGREPEYFVP